MIPNDKLLELVPRLPLNAAFKVADEVLVRAIKGITELITKPGLVNLDFNDLRTIMKGGGVAMIGLGEGDEDDRMEHAVDEAINSPLIDVDISGASGALVNVTGGENMSISEAERVAEIIQSKITPNARIIWGAAVDPALRGQGQGHGRHHWRQVKEHPRPEGDGRQQERRRRFHPLGPKGI